MTTAKIDDGAVTSEKLNSTVSFSAKRTNDSQTTSSGSGTKIQFNVEDFDLGNNYDSTTNYRFTAPYDGVYHFDAMVQFDATGTQTWCQLVVNATVVAQDVRYSNTTNDDQSASASKTLSLTAGDTVEVRGLQNSGSTRAVLGSSVGGVYFSGHLVGRT